jgi:hypothetical protein
VATQRPVSGWAIGWTTFAAIMLVIVGIFQGIAGLAALLEDEVYVLGEEYIFKFDLTTWGWVHLIIAVVLFATGLGLFSGAMWARVIGVMVAGLSMIVNFAYLPWYPIWSIVMITVNIFVIWALTVHGRDVIAEAEPERMEAPPSRRHTVS